MRLRSVSLAFCASSGTFGKPAGVGLAAAAGALFFGQKIQMRAVAAILVSYIGLAVIFIYLILASQFASFLQPVALMSSLPLTLIGVVGALLVWRSTVNMFSIIGIVMLMGLVTKNAILLVDFANQARRHATR